MARDFNVPIGRLRSRLENKPSASSIRGIHRRRLTPEQDLTLDKHSIRSKDPDNRESLTSIESINGAGGSIPSFLILTGMMIMNSWSNNNLNEDVVLSTAETGYSNDWLSLKWLKHFDTHSIKTRKGAYRLLLMDGYGSHHTIEFIEYCNEAKIIPFGLPAHTTHLLQPLDVVVFQPLKYWHSEAVKESMAQGDETFTKVEFLNAFNSFRRKTFKRSTVLSAWRQVGLIPFNPSIVLDKLPKRKLFSEFSSPPRHPDEAYEAAFSTPRNFQELKEASYNIESVYPDAMNLHKFMKGALAVARKDELIVDQLAHTKAAENARRIRANQTKRVIQKGVIRVEDCRKMTSERMEEENRLETTRQNKLILNQRKRWGPVMRELTRKTPYYIQGGSYAFSCK